MPRMSDAPAGSGEGAAECQPGGDRKLYTENLFETLERIADDEDGGFVIYYDDKSRDGYAHAIGSTHERLIEATRRLEKAVKVIFSGECVHNLEDPDALIILIRPVA